MYVERKAKDKRASGDQTVDKREPQTEIEPEYSTRFIRETPQHGECEAIDKTRTCLFPGLTKLHLDGWLIES